jgi:hypothetical protein
MTSEAYTSQPSADAWEPPMVFTAEKYGDDINQMFEDLSRGMRQRMP